MISDYIKKFPIPILFVLVLCYFHTPWHLAKALYRLVNVQELAIQYAENCDSLLEPKESPDNIRKIVDGNITYYNDFPLHGRAFCLQSPEEALISRKGDCKTRAILLHSILKRRNIPAELMITMEHWWVEYEGKKLDSWQAVHENPVDSIISAKLDMKKRIENIFRVWKRSARLWLDLVLLHMPPTQRTCLIFILAGHFFALIRVFILKWGKLAYNAS